MIMAGDLGAPEGPVALPDGAWLIVEAAAERGCVTRLSADGRRSVIKQTGRPNGLAVDAAGVIWVAESKTPSLLRLTMDGKCDVVAQACDGEPFLFPNDLCFGPDGGLYLPTNVAFALPGQHRIHVTEFQYGQMEVFPVSRDGLRLWDGAARRSERLSQ
jgi:sugar lactone lactonase YvrE